MRCDGGCSVLHKASECGAQAHAACCGNCHRKAPFLYHHFVMAQKGRLLSGYSLAEDSVHALPLVGSPDKPRGLSIQPCKSEKEEPYIRHSSQGRSECLYLRIE